MSSRSFKSAALALASACFVSVVPAQEAPERFNIRMGKGALSGTEEYRIESSPEGRKLSGTVRVQQGGRGIDYTHELEMDADWGLRRYRLTSILLSQTQTVEAVREGSQVRMRAEMGSQATARPAPFQANTIVLDNLVTGHYQVLLHRLSGTEKPNAEWSVLVPQALASLGAKLEGPETATGRCGGQACDLAKYSLRLANVLIEFWAEKRSHRLMRVNVPVQDLDIVREGFEPQREAPASPVASAPPGREVQIPSGNLQVPGILTLPASVAGKVPVVVLVHGSGPQDRDETIGPNKPFRDVALGLAARGIASLRYDKRTLAFKQSLDPRKITVEEEVLADAAAALEFVRSLPEIDPARVFLLGHSLGGSMTPFIAERVGFVRGVILLAAAARPLDELIYEQISHAMALAGTSASEIAAKLAELRKSFARIRSGKASDDETVFFASARYWRHLFTFDVLAGLSKFDRPVLVLQGGKDVQVRRTDFDLIEKALSAKPATLKELHWLPELNHLFMKVEGEPTAAEYGKPGTVEAQAIDIIAAWIKAKG